MCEKFHYDRLRNNRALADRQSDDNKKNDKNKVRSGSGRVGSVCVGLCGSGRVQKNDPRPAL